MAGITPLPGYVLIKPIEDDDKTETGLYLSEQSKDKPQRGEVIKISGYIDFGDHYGETLGDDCQVGNKVYFKKWGTEDIKYKGESYVLVKYQDLLAIYE